MNFHPSHVLPKHDTRCQLDEVHIEGLRYERYCAGCPDIALDDFHGSHRPARGILRHELNVEGARDVEGLAQLSSDLHHPPVRLQMEALSGQKQRRVSAVRSSILNMLGDGIVDDFTHASNTVELYLPGSLDVLRHDHRELLLDHSGGSKEAFQVFLAVNNSHGSARKHIGRPDEHRKAHAFRKRQCVLQVDEFGPFRLVNAQLITHA
mmetsp:Transcript_22913/g.40425  ORF Transcript_22913/g.40425 Transcript_22913/m.40425 type:complete len:208 (-) Transcript_22913:3549-4172(-)